MKNNDLMVARFAARQDQLVYGIAFTPGMMMGTFFPILVPGYMYFISDNRALNNTGAVAVQATSRQADPVQGHHRPALLQRHQRRRAQRENISSCLVHNLV